MKKLMILAAAAAMASGAWASSTYTMTFVLDNLPSIDDPSGQHDTFYLQDTQTGKVLLYVDRATDMKVTTDATGANVWSLNGDGVHDAADLMATGNNALIAAASDENVAAHKISSITMTKTSSDSNARNLMVTFTMDGDPEFDFEGGKPSPHSEGGTDSYAGYADHIVARVTNNNDVEGSWEFAVETHTITLGESVTGGAIGWSLTASMKAPTPTPEPTSAMLVLLGVMGLALKRKVA